MSVLSQINRPPIRQTLLTMPVGATLTVTVLATSSNAVIQKIFWFELVASARRMLDWAAPDVMMPERSGKPSSVTTLPATVAAVPLRLAASVSVEPELAAFPVVEM